MCLNSNLSGCVSNESTNTGVAIVTLYIQALLKHLALKAVAEGCDYIVQVTQL